MPDAVARRRPSLQSWLRHSPSPTLRYAAAVVLAALGILLILQVGTLRDDSPYLFSFGAVMLASWYGGLGPGILASVISALGVDYWVREPVGEFTIFDGSNVLPAVLFVGVASVISWLNGAWLHATEQQEHLLNRERAARSVAETARAEAEQARSQVQFLGEASAALPSSLVYEETLRQVANLVVPRLADWCSVHVLGDDGSVTQLAVAHADPRKVAWARHLQERYPPDPDAPTGLPQVLRTGQPELYPEVPDAMLVAGAKDEEHLAILRSVGLTSAMIVPMIARELVIGAIAFVAAESGRRYGPDDLALAELLARRCAQAVDNARLYREAQEAEARYRSLFEGTAEAVLVAAPDGRYLDANPAASELLGYSREEFRRLRLGDVSGQESESAEGEVQGFLGVETWRGEVDLRRKDGTTVPAEGRARPVDLPSGTVYVGTWRDVTERKELERLQQEFVATVSHDLKNPLVGVKGQAQLLRRRIARADSIDPAHLQEGLAAIEAAAGRMEALLEELSDVAWVRLGQPLELHRAPTDLVACACRSVEHHQQATDRHAISLDASVPEMIGTWDAVRLERVFDNLLGNAIKYSPDGGAITVSIACRDDAAEGWAVLTVRDEGLGIPAADLPHVFERFRRGSNVATWIAGRGIGLAGAKQIVEQHGGTIAVESEEGRGSTFTVRLPLTGGGPAR